jgi:undecaprenyl-diphosphatase
MFETVNLSVFHALNAPANPDSWKVEFAYFSAEYLLFAVAAMMVFGWIIGRAPLRRALTVAGFTVVAGLGLNRLIGLFMYNPRPFEAGIGHQFLEHVTENSFPSDHGTLLFAVACGLLFSQGGRFWGAVAFVVALVVAWSRIYLGVHWPLDMAGSLLVSIVCALLVQTVLAPVVDLVNNMATRVFSVLTGRSA